MSNLTETAIWESGIYQIEETDLVRGGATGISNTQSKQLANRTLWLKENIGIKTKYAAVVALTANTTITNAHLGKLLYANVTANVTLQLDDIANFNEGDILTIATRAVSGVAIEIQAASLQTIDFNGDNVDIMYLLQQEFVELTKIGGNWVVTDCSSSILEVGDCLDAYKQRPNTIVRQGQILSRSQYPRLWQWINTKLAFGQELVADNVWLSSVNYQGCFSTGNGATTFRVPDDRSMFTRYLDLGRGIDYDRAHNYAGGYEADSLKAHDHVMHGKGSIPGANLYLSKTSNRYSQGGGGDNLGGKSTPDENLRTGDTGGSETRPKNTGKLPLIKI